VIVSETMPHRGEHRTRVVGGMEEPRQGPDHARLTSAVRVLEHQGVEPVLAVQGVAHPGVPGHRAHADDPEVEGLPRVHQRVDVHRLVGAVEPAHPEVDDPLGEAGPVVRRPGHPLGKRVQGALAEHGHTTLLRP
jgi:hypothetical protein